MPVQKAKPEVAFLAAFLALLVMPLLVALGLSLFGLAAGLRTSVDRMVSGGAGWGPTVVFLVWVGIVVAVVLMLISRLIRSTARS